MLLLAVDTSGRNGSLALVRADEGSFEVLELVPLAGRMYSAQLIPALQDSLSNQRLLKTDLDAFAVASGPGSFTGLRVGLSTVKALSLVLQKPITAVSVLEAAAYMTQTQGRITVALDAGRKQVFVGEYNINDAGAECRQELLLGYEQFFDSVKGGVSSLFSPDAAVREAAAAHGIMIHESASPQADMYARIGLRKIGRGETVPAELLEANYIRASDAELFSLPKLSQ